MSRLEPLPRDQLGDLEPALETFRNRMGFVANSGLIMARRPAIVRSIAELARSILENGVVSLAFKCCVAQIASWTSGCLYCQAHFANNLLRHGVLPEKVENLWNFEHSELFSDAERAALRFTMAASQVPNGVTDEHFVELRRFWNDGEIVEILATICYTGFLNRWNDSLATTLEDIPARAGEHLHGTNWTRGKHG